MKHPKIALPGKRKPWNKCSPEGRLYWDTKHPDFIKWFTQQVETLPRLVFDKEEPRSKKPVK